MCLIDWYVKRVCCLVRNKFIVKSRGGGTYRLLSFCCEQHNPRSKFFIAARGTTDMCVFGNDGKKKKLESCFTSQTKINTLVSLAACGFVFVFMCERAKKIAACDLCK